jgi:hypothetical protein
MVREFYSHQGGVSSAARVESSYAPISIQSYPFNLNACGAAVNYVNSDNRLAGACGRAAVRPHAAVRRVKNGPEHTTTPV